MREWCSKTLKLSVMASQKGSSTHFWIAYFLYCWVFNWYIELLNYLLNKTIITCLVFLSSLSSIVMHRKDYFKLIYDIHLVPTTLIHVYVNPAISIDLCLTRFRWISSSWAVSSEINIVCLLVIKIFQNSYQWNMESSHFEQRRVSFMEFGAKRVYRPQFHQRYLALSNT